MQRCTPLRGKNFTFISCCNLCEAHRKCELICISQIVNQIYCGNRTILLEKYKLENTCISLTRKITVVLFLFFRCVADSSCLTSWCAALSFLSLTHFDSILCLIVSPQKTNGYTHFSFRDVGCCFFFYGEERKKKSLSSQ